MLKLFMLYNSYLQFSPMGGPECPRKKKKEGLMIETISEMEMWRFRKISHENYLKQSNVKQASNDGKQALKNS